jgi:DNA repair protein RecO (recombination protein O)
VVEAPVALDKSRVLTLKCQDWSETSQVVHLLARDAGRFRSLAKGSKRGLNAFGGPLDRWVLGEAVFSLRDANRLAVLTELYETERFPGLRRGLPAFFGASLVTELVTALVPEVDPQPPVFDLAVGALRLLERADGPACRAVAFAFAYRLLGLLGYGPEMGRCVECGRALADGEGRAFSPGQGGAVCPNCRPKGRTLPLNARSAEAIAFLTGAEWEEVLRVRLSDPTTGQIRRALAEHVLELSGKQLLALSHV